MTLAYKADLDTTHRSIQSENPSGCQITITAVSDRRADPDIIGIYLGKAVKAPADRESWIKSKISALRLRGVEPVFIQDGAQPGTITTEIALEKAWVTTLYDIAASAAFRVDERMPDGSVETSQFRGTRQKLVIFSGIEGSIQRGIDSAFDQALDAMAKHFLARCETQLTEQVPPP